MVAATKVRQRIRRLATVTALASLSLCILPHIAAAQSYSPEDIERINREYQDSLKELQELKKVYSGMPAKAAPAPASQPVPVVVPEAAPVEMMAPPVEMVAPTPPPASPVEMTPPRVEVVVPAPVMMAPPPPPLTPIVDDAPRIIPTPPTVKTFGKKKEDEKIPASIRRAHEAEEAQTASVKEIPEALVAQPPIRPTFREGMPPEVAAPEVAAPAMPAPNYPVQWEASAPAPEPLEEPMALAPSSPAPVAVIEKPMPMTPMPVIPVPVVIVTPHEPHAPEAKAAPQALSAEDKNLPASMRLLGHHGPIALPPEPEEKAENVVLQEAPVASPEYLATPEYMPESMPAELSPDKAAALAALHDAEAALAAATSGPASFGAKEPMDILPEGAPVLSDKTSEFLHKIPAAALSTHEKDVLHVREPVTIDRLQAKSVFPPQEEETDNIAVEEEDTDEAKAKPVKIGRKDPSIRDELGLVVQIKNKDMSAFENLKAARDALYAGQSETAVTLYKRVLEAEPQNKQAMFGLATAYHVTGQLEQARDLYQQLLMLDQNNWPALNNLFILASEEAPEDALRHLQELEKVNPHFAPIPAQIGMIHLQKGNYPEAARNLGHAAVLDPENMRYRFDLALLLEHVGDRKTAGMLYKQLLDAGTKGKELPESSAQIQARLSGLMAKEITGNN